MNYLGKHGKNLKYNLTTKKYYGIQILAYSIQLSQLREPHKC